MRLLSLLIALFFIFQFTNSGYSIDASEIINKVKKKYETVESFSAEFQQSFKWKLAGETQQQEGKIFLKNFDKFRIETDNQLIVSDGKTLWTYSADNNQVLIDDLSNAEDILLPRQLFLKFSEEYNPVLLGEEKYNDADCYALRLVAKNEEVFIKEMKIWIQKDSWLTLKIEHIDINENVTIYTLNNILINKKVDDKYFTYQIPPNVEVIDMR